MHRNVFIARFCLLAISILSLGMSAAFGRDQKFLTNHVGYEPSGPKHAVILGTANDKFTDCFLRDAASDQKIIPIEAKAIGPVQKWRDWYFWTLDFDSFTRRGKY